MKINDLKKDSHERKVNWIEQRNDLIRNQLSHLSHILRVTLQDFEEMQKKLTALQENQKKS